MKTAVLEVIFQKRNSIGQTTPPLTKVVVTDEFLRDQPKLARELLEKSLMEAVDKIIERLYTPRDLRPGGIPLPGVLRERRKKAKGGKG